MHVGLYVDVVTIQGVSNHALRGSKVFQAMFLGDIQFSSGAVSVFVLSASFGPR